MSDGKDNDAGADEDFQAPPTGDGELTQEETDAWAQAVAGMKPDEIQGDKEPTEAKAKTGESEGETGDETEGNAAPEEKENAGEPTDLPSEADVRLKEAEEKAARLEARLAALEGKTTEDPKGEKAEEKPVDFTERVMGFLPKDLPDEKKEEVKALLDYTEGLPTLLTALRESIRNEVFEQIRQDEAAKSAKADEAAKDAKYWDDLGTWFQGEYPEFKLEQVRADQKFAQWAKVNDAWISDQLNRTGRFDPSGARVVFQKFMERAYPDAPKASGKDSGNERRLAAARTPSSLGTRSSRADASAPSANLWDQEVAKLNAKEKAAGRRYL